MDESRGMITDRKISTYITDVSMQFSELTNTDGCFPGQVLPYPEGVFAAELLLLFVMAGLEAIRLFFGGYLSTQFYL